MSAALHPAPRASDEASLCDALWDVAGTAAHSNIAWVLPLLSHGTPRVRRFATIALKSLHPLCGLPAVESLAQHASESLGAGAAEATAMNDWLAPRAHFRGALFELLRSGQCNQLQLASSLARLPGEQPLISEILREHATAEAVASYEKQWRVRARVPEQLIIALTYRCNRQCPYCYAYESQDELRGDIELTRAEEALDWAVQQSITLVSFTGGEPTCHPRFAELVAMVRARGMRLYLNSNGLFGKSVLKALSDPTIVDVGVHVSAPELHRPAELPAISRNIRALRSSGVDVFVRYTLSSSAQSSLPWLMDFCAEHGVHHLNLALGFPGRSASNEYLPSRRFDQVKPALFQALSLAAERGIRVRSSKPIPLCLFTRDEYARFQRHHFLTSTCTVHHRGGVHNLVVNPDLSTYTCVGLPFRGPQLTAAPDYAPQREHCQKRVRLALSVVQSGCQGCAVYPLGVCQSSCLGHCSETSSSAGANPS